MTNTQFSTIIRLFAEQNKYIDKRFEEVDQRFDRRFNQESEKRTAEHLAIMKAIETPFLEHEARITRLEKQLINS